MRMPSRRFLRAAEIRGSPPARSDLRHCARCPDVAVRAPDESFALRRGPVHGKAAISLRARIVRLIAIASLVPARLSAARKPSR